MNQTLELLKPAPTIQERLDAGELVHVTDVMQPAYDDLMPDIRGGQFRQQQLQELRKQYGRDSVVTGSHYDAETHTTKPDRHWLGVYVTKKAFYSVHRDK